MNVEYTVDGQPGALQMPATYLLFANPKDLAELVASDFWRNQPPPETCQVHLQRVDGMDLGVFEVRSVTRPVFTAKPVTQG
ncbi:hypothetical protein ACYU03_01715 [Pseudomonas sp. X10]